MWKAKWHRQDSTSARSAGFPRPHTFCPAADLRLANFFLQGQTVCSFVFASHKVCRTYSASVTEAPNKAKLNGVSLCQTLLMDTEMWISCHFYVSQNIPAFGFFLNYLEMWKPFLAWRKSRCGQMWHASTPAVNRVNIRKIVNRLWMRSGMKCFLSIFAWPLQWDPRFVEDKGQGFYIFCCLR